MAIPTNCIDVGVASDFLSKDVLRIAGRIARSLAINSPWINILETSTFESGVSDVQRSVVQEAIAPVLSQCNPIWGGFDCSLPPQTVCYGSTEYQYRPEMYFEKACPMCLQTSFSAFRNAIRMVEMSYSDHITTLWNSWIRAKMLNLSATKITVNSTVDFSSMLATGFQTNFVAGLTPDSPLTFKFLKYVANYLTHSLLAGPEFQWRTSMGTTFRFISDQDTIDAMRNQADVRSDLRFAAAGSDARSRNALMEFSWEGPYQGIQFGVDQTIIRASGINAAGEICCVEPFLPAAATQGTKRVVNPAWLSAPYQVSFLIAKNSFVREIPAEFLGEGLTKFDRQNWGGKLTWHNVLDNCDNITGNKGFHYWQLAAAFRPERPEFVIPILHLRCAASFCLTPCTPSGYYTSCV